jgi:hypothetical protein
MATGLNLDGLNGLTFTAGEISVVQASQSGGGNFNVTGALGTVASMVAGISSVSTMAMQVAGSAIHNSAQSMDPGGVVVGFTFAGPASASPYAAFGSAQIKLVGWNADGLLFSDAANGGNFIFIADPNAPTTPIGADGLPMNASFNTNTSDIPFGLNSITVPCFAAGTQIGTPDGEIAVEKLKEGDGVLTASGKVRTVKWVGNRRVNCRRHPRALEVMPVRIKAHAFGGNTPQRDLLVSPGHSIYVDGVLIPAGFLVNGATVVQDDVEHIHYYHIELDVHDVLLAEGLSAESYLDDENRHAFNNGTDYAALHPDLDPKSWENACAPRVMAGPQLTEVKQRLIDQADSLGYHLTDEADVHLLADGQKITPCHTVGTRHWFMVPAGAREVRLNSNSGVPMQLIADHGDGRCLGVAVSEFKVDGETLALEQMFEANPYPIETHGAFPWIWTNGSVPLAMALPTDTMAMIEVAIVMSMKSWSRRPNLSVVPLLVVANAG